MPGDPNSPIVECNNCGKRAMWDQEVVDGLLVKHLPRGWSMVKNTYSGDVYFDSARCEKVWCNTREYKAPIPPQIAGAKAEVEAAKNPRRRGWPRVCECGLGPFKNKLAMAAHIRSRRHADQVAAAKSDKQLVGV